MADISTYNELIQRIQDTAEDDGDEFIAAIPNFVFFAEKRLFVDCDFTDLEKETTANMSNGTATVNKPSNYGYLKLFYITVSGARKILRRKTIDYMIDYWPDSSVTDEPKYYSEFSDSQFIVAPTPSQNYNYIIRYMQRPNYLEPSNQTNYFVLNCPDLLFFACMVEAARFMKAWTQVQYWEQAYQDRRIAWNYEQGRKRRDDGNVPKNPDGGPNTIMHNVNNGSTA